MDLRSLEIFYWVAQLGSFRGAADRLNTTQPAISHRIAGLEAEVGVTLLNRGSRVATLTPKGREFRDYAERILVLVDEAEKAVATPRSRGGIVRIGVAETIVHTWLARYIEQVHANFPGITLEIEVDVSPNLRNALVENRLDLCFLMGPVSDPNMTNVDLCRYGLAFIGNRELNLGPEPLDLRRLLQRPIITYQKTTKPYILLRQLLSRSDLPAPRIYSSSSLSTIVRMTLDGIGISAIPPAVIGPELERGELRVLKTDVNLPDLGFTATMRSGVGQTAAEALVELATQVAAATSDNGC